MDGHRQRPNRRLGLIQVGEIDKEVPAAETTTYTSSSGHVSYETTFRYRLENAGEEFTIQSIAATLEYGEDFTAPGNMAVTVNAVDLQKYYEYEDYDGNTAEERASVGKQWAFVRLHVENKGDESNFTPLETDIWIVASNSQYDSTYINKDEGRYDGGEIEPGIVREGWIAYEIPDDLSQGDFAVSWRGEDYLGTWTARWRADA